ncbi:aldehyde dehydrogenase family protein [Acinetobacter baumannii]|uniref:aldehyde dehydrogenase family protein n=1 Tax=Acinetobacter baumannii TaxID=470 RepID=UPI003F673FA7
MAVWTIAPTFASANSLVLIPSTTTPASTLLLSEIAAPFFPQGPFNVVVGPAQVG